MRRRTALFHALALSALLMPLPTATAFAADKTVALTYIVEHPAIDAARTTGSQRLDELGISREKGEETIRNLLEGLTDAARASGKAAVDAVRNQG